MNARPPPEPASVRTMPIWPLNSSRRSNHSPQVFGGDLTNLRVVDEPELRAPEQQARAVQRDAAIDLVVLLRYPALVGDFLRACRIERFEIGSCRDHVRKIEVLEEHEREPRLAVAPGLHLQLQRRARADGVFDLHAGLLGDRRDQVGLPESLEVRSGNRVDHRQRAGRARGPGREGTGGERSNAPPSRWRRETYGYVNMLLPPPIARRAVLFR